jgi:hypothetical protein
MSHPDILLVVVHQRQRELIERAAERRLVRYARRRRSH